MTTTPALLCRVCGLASTDPDIEVSTAFASDTLCQGCADGDALGAE